MPTRRTFVRLAAWLAAGAALTGPALAASAPAAPNLPVVRPARGLRKFHSPAVEAMIAEFARHVPDPELTWLFGNCLPNTLDTTVRSTTVGGQPDTYVITGDIDAMWLRDSAAQVWPYLPLAPQEAPLRQLLAGVIRRQTRYILLDPYANAFYDDPARVGEWAHDQTTMRPGIHERKWEVDSLCYPLRLAYHYWKTTGDTQPFDADWRRAVALIVSTFREQQQKTGPGPYHFQREATNALDTRPLAGYGYPVRPCGLIASAFRPSDDATRLSFLVPSNFFAVVSLRQAALMLNDIYHDEAGYADLMKLADEIAGALRQHAVVAHPELGQVYAYEVDGYGSHTLMDDANAPSLLALPYLDAIPLNDPVYQNTRRLSLSAANPFFYQGTAAAGLGSPHTGPGRIWPLAIALRGLTSTDPAEIRACVQGLKASQAGTGYLHESFDQNDPRQYSRSWFAWANGLGAEFLWKVYREHPELLG